MVHRYSRSVRNSQWGFSLLELIAATAMIAMTLVPALAFLRDGMSMSEKGAVRSQMSIYAASKLDEYLARCAANWFEGSVNGDFALDGNAHLRFTVECSDSALDGGLEAQLMSVTATVYHDENENDVRDSEEPQLTYRSKIAKTASYENAAGS